MSAQQAREALAMLQTRVVLSAGTKYEVELSMAPRVLTWLGARGEVVRALNDGHWRTPRPLWARMDASPKANELPCSHNVRPWWTTG